MKRRIVIPIITIMAVACLTGCGARATPKENKINTISITELTEVDNKPQYFPFSVSSYEEDGETLLVKNYEVPADINPYDLIEDTFDRGKFKYEVRDILMKKSEPKKETKLASIQVVINSNTNDMNSILKQAPVIIDYDKDGYKGQLLMNTSNLFTESLGTKSYSYTVTDTKTYTDLARNDTSYIAKSITKNGKELTLVNVDWQTTGTTLVGSTLVPSSYNAVAYYSGTAYGSKSTGYATTVTYIGEVTREVQEDSIISIVYVGERIYNLTWLWILLSVAAIAGVGAGLIFILRKRTNEDDEAEVEDDEKENCEIAKERVQEAIKTDHQETVVNEVQEEKPKVKKDKVKVYVKKDESGELNEET